MDATVNDFFNEINQLSSKTDPKESSEVWQECYDELTGYSYFWNTETDEVTWVPPKSFKPAENASKKPNTPKPLERDKKRPELFMPPTAISAPQYSTLSVKPEAKVKVYSIQDAMNQPEAKQTVGISSLQYSTSSVKPSVKPEAKVKVYSIQDAMNTMNQPRNEAKQTVGISALQYSTSSAKPEAKVKVYPIKDAMKKPETKQKSLDKASFKKPDDSDDEKIELITEYGRDSDSDAEEEKPPDIAKYQKNKIKSAKLPVSSPTRRSTSSTIRKPLPPRRRGSQSDNDDEDDDDDIDLLAKIQQRAQELKKLGGQVPPAIKHIIHNSDRKEKGEKPNAISGFSLVAGYNSDSSDSESDNKETVPSKLISPVAPPPKPVPETSHSTLFPITKPIDVKDFIGSEPLQSEIGAKTSDDSVANNDFHSKAFQRKRRIGVSLVNSAKRPKEEAEVANSEFTGFGFKSDGIKNASSSEGVPNSAKSTYPAFQKGGVMFVKSDILNASMSTDEMLEEKTESKEKHFVDIANNYEGSFSKKETEDDYSVLREKLLFLGEGREPVFPVQVMLIQAETLFLAMKEDGLKLSYLHKWLKEMCSELVKLEKEAAPEGWLLQWDRSHKRYFYQNQMTGVTQWRYPEPDVTRCDDAMDICTTPPPPPQALADEPEPAPPGSPVIFGPQLPPPEPPMPPSPPTIRSPTPPPPPMISMEMAINPSVPDVPLPPEPQPPETVVLQPPLPPLENGQPLPPGVDLLPDVFNKPKEPELKVPDTLNTALDSFYSEIAEVSENANPGSPAPPLQIPQMPFEGSQDLSSSLIIEAPKKKKKKVKLAQGLTMKKKGVSQLVEKWKNVQKSYGD